MKTRRFRMSFVVCLLTVAVLVGLAGACAGPTTPAPTTPAPTTPAPATPAPAAPAPAAPGPAAPAPAAPGPAAPGPAAPAPAAGPKYGGTLRMIVTEDPTGSMGVPENMRGAGSAYTKEFVLEPLVIQGMDGAMHPWLAESFDWSGDHTTCTFHLRKGVQFHDGTPFNAEAVQWNWDRATAARAVGTMDVESTEIIDDYTIAFHLKEYRNVWINNITSSNQAQTSLMISPTAYKTNGEEWANWHPVGTGPFKFVSYTEGQSLKLERFDDYWGERPYIDAIDFVLIADFITAQIAFEAGEGDTIRVTGHDRDLARDLLPKDKGYWALESPGLMNTIIPPGARPASPFSNLKVREAVDYAIDKVKICESIYAGWAYPKYATAYRFQLPYDPNFKGREYNPDKARQLLTEAGYPHGFKTSLYCQVLTYGKDVDAVQAYLQNVGIDAKMEVISVGKWIEMETFGWDDGLLMSFIGPESYRGQVERDWITPTEPNWFRGLWYETLYRPPELEELVQGYFKLSDIEEEKAQGKKIVKLLYDEAIVLPLWEQVGVMVLQPYVKCTDTAMFSYSAGMNSRPITRFWLDR